MSKIKPGKKDLVSKEDLEPQNIKERISIWVPEEVVNGFRERAKAEDTKYQTLMNEALRLFLKRPSLVERVEKLEEKLGIKEAS